MAQSYAASVNKSAVDLHLVRPVTRLPKCTDRVACLKRQVHIVKDTSDTHTLSTLSGKHIDCPRSFKGAS